MSKIFLGIVFAFLFLASMSFYIIDQREVGVLFRLGEIVKSDIRAGIYFKYPFVNNVRTFDSRILTLNAQPESFLTSEKKNVIVDFFVKWRINDVGQYFRSTRGEERNAQSRLSQVMKDGLRNEFGKRTIKQVVSGQRQEIMDVLRDKSNQQVKTLGIEIIDVRISRIDLPDDVSDSVYDRMRAERHRVARDFRAKGNEKAERIRAEADRDRSVILAKAYRDAEIVRGEGDAESAKIYALAYNQDPEFYSFSRSLKAYVAVFKEMSDLIVLEPNSRFFRYFSEAEGKKPRQ